MGKKTEFEVNQYELSLSLDKDTLYFHGFPKLQNKVAILYTAESSPAIITNGENHSSITCFEISERKCSSPQIIEYFNKKGSINHLFSGSR